LASIALAGLDVVVCEFLRTPSLAAEATGGGEARLGALADQAALEFRQRTKHVKSSPPCAVVVSTALVRDD
jgi:hypothetical protein